MPLTIRRATSRLRADAFPTRLRHGEIESISVSFTATAPDPRIDAHAIDYFNACKGYLGCVFHYLIDFEGSVWVCRDPKRVTSRTRNFTSNQCALHIGVCGGLDAETGERIQSTSVAQAEALEALEQTLADTLGTPLDVFDSRPSWTRDIVTFDDPDVIEDQHEELEAIEGF